jgi:uncharacterized protein YcaQ
VAASSGASGAARPVSLRTIRRLALAKQSLSGPRRPATRNGLLDLTRELRSLQLDPISVVARSHLLVLWSRVGSFEPELVDSLLFGEGALFEYWAHAAAIVLTEDFPLHRLHMRSWPGGGLFGDRVRTWMADNASLRRSILVRLRREGPLGSRAFGRLASRSWTSTGWTNERNVERMLTFLWAQGKVLVAGRSGGSRLWDLADRVLPVWTPREPVGARRAARRAAELSLKALGAGRPAHVRDHFVAGRFAGVPQTLDDLEGAGRVIRLSVTDAGVAPGPWFVHGDDLPLLDRIEAREWEPRTTLLSPFDNIIHNRDRTLELFGFHYRIQIYVPAAKRPYGYYVMPLLDGERIIARIDPVLDRRANRLVVKAVHREPGSTARAVDGALRGSLSDLAGFLGAGSVVRQRPER